MPQDLIIQCDFDGTITTNNTSLLIREEFATGDWQKIESDYTRGRLSVEESNKRQYTLIKESRDKLMAFSQENAAPRAGFLEFVDYCRATGIEFVIVSSGLDFYIESVLRQIGAPPLELCCGRTSFGQDGITVSYIGPDGNTLDQGFKRAYLASLRQRGNRIAYIGDGLSDLEAASDADLTFAIGTLHKLLEAKSVTHYTFSDFHDILRQIQRL